jgi:hypothetical protein
MTLTTFNKINYLRLHQFPKFLLLFDSSNL